VSEVGPTPSTLSVEVSREGDTTLVAVRGFIDAGAPLAAIGEATGSQLILDLQGVKRISSFGVSALMDALRAVPVGTAIVWRRVSVPLMLQVSMIENFNGRATIESFYAPYFCAACGHEQQCLLEVAAMKVGPAPHRAPSVACAECGRPATFDELEADYFAFL
jgi:anti-anti-sigma regulatory factor